MVLHITPHSSRQVLAKLAGDPVKEWKAGKILANFYLIRI